MATATPGDGDLVILHLGLGSFHRAHQAVYLHHLREQGDRRWSLAGGNIRPDMLDTLAALERQGGAYTLETVTPQGVRAYERITSIRRIVPFDAALRGLVEVGADPSTRIVSFTVTEAGYYLDAKDKLDLGFADLASDLEGRTRVTVYGALEAILGERMRRGSGPVTLLNCDNLRHNGDRSRGGLLEFLDRRGQKELAAWVRDHTTSPNAMVDRITPRPTAEVRARVKAATGVDDEAALMGEAFLQWVIEDRFCNGRPAWEKAGALLVASVAPYEEAKIRILNATHSCIAWAGTLVGYQYIHEGTHDPRIRKMGFDYVTEDVIPCLDRPGARSPLDLAAYRDTVLDRFGNPDIRDTNQRVAADGFSKIPGFMVPTLRERLGRGEPIARVAVLPALFLAFLRRWHRGELPYAYQDGVMDPAAAHAICAAPDPLQAFGRDPVLWGPLAGDPTLGAALAKAWLEVEAFVGKR
jgi:D-arabinitol 4-dehydrogenase